MMYYKTIKPQSDILKSLPYILIKKLFKYGNSKKSIN